LKSINPGKLKDITDCGLIFVHSPHHPFLKERTIEVRKNYSYECLINSSERQIVIGSS
jgi:hypothetical protein